MQSLKASASIAITFSELKVEGIIIFASEQVPILTTLKPSATSTMCKPWLLTSSDCDGCDPLLLTGSDCDGCDPLLLTGSDCDGCGPLLMTGSDCDGCDH